MSALAWHMGNRSSASIKAERLQAANTKRKAAGTVIHIGADVDSTVPEPKIKARFSSAPSVDNVQSSPLHPSLHQLPRRGEKSLVSSKPKCCRHRTAFGVDPETLPINGTIATSDCNISSPARLSAAESSQRIASCQSPPISTPEDPAHQTAFDVEPETAAISSMIANTEEMTEQTDEMSILIDKVSISCAQRCSLLRLP